MKNWKKGNIFKQDPNQPETS